MTPALRLAVVCVAHLLGCAEDKVYPGFYGPTASEELSVRHGMSGAAGAASGSLGGSGGAAGMGISMDVPPPTAGATGGSSIAGGSIAPEPTEDEPTAPVPSDACDLSGRWLVTLHQVTEAIGQQQTAHSYAYYEIERDGAGFAIRRGLHCGDDAIAEGLFAISVDFSRAADAIREHVSYLDRPVTSVASAGGCDVRFGKWYVVQGATYAHYIDPTTTLPTLAEQASGGVPGWEDWDGDGQAGITGYVSGVIAGKVFLTPRAWTELSGTVPSVGERIRLKLNWDQTKNVIGYDGSELLASDAVRAGDPSLHFAELARLEDDQATGDDAAICDAVVQLAKTLTPTAAGI